MVHVQPHLSTVESLETIKIACENLKKLIAEILAQNEDLIELREMQARKDMNMMISALIGVAVGALSMAIYFKMI